MLKFFNKRSRKTGLPPGTLVHVGDKKTEKVTITLIDYDEHHYEERAGISLEECFPFKDSPTITWINVDGLHEVNIIEKLGTHFGLHSLTEEDILSTGQRPKAEEGEKYFYIVLRMIYLVDDETQSEQVSIVLGQNFILTFQERERDVFNPIRERLRNGKGRVRKLKADYLAYCLIDAIVDHYFVILEKFGEDIENLEDELMDNPSSETLQKIHAMKGEMIFLRKSIWPVREMVNTLERTESSLISKNTRIFLRDLYDHTIQVIDTVESFRDMVSGMLDIYLSSLSNKMNEVMKVLTIIATIFIPLTFIAGIYGMNFDFMPELGWHWSYPYGFWAVIFVIAGALLLFFKKKDWL